MPTRQRVLLIASETYDSVGYSFRRTLADHYDIASYDFQRYASSGIRKLTGGRVPAWVDRVVQFTSRGILRDPNALAHRALIEAAREFEPDILVTTEVPWIPADVVAKIRRALPNTRIVGVYSDHLANFERGYFFVADYDALFFKDRYLVDKMREKLGWKHVWYLPQACDPQLHRPVTLSDDDRERFGCDLTIAGTLHYFRAAEFAPLIGRNLKIWGAHPGAWFKHPILAHQQGVAVFGMDKCKAMLAAKIVLNCNHYAEIAGTNKRTFEVAGIGAFQLTDTPALADVFAPDHEVATFTSQADLLEKIEYYLPRPELRAQMAARAQKRAHAEHTYAHRWAAIAGVLGVDLPPTFPVPASELAVKAQ